MKCVFQFLDTFVAFCSPPKIFPKFKMTSTQIFHSPAHLFQYSIPNIQNISLSKNTHTHTHTVCASLVKRPSSIWFFRRSVDHRIFQSIAARYFLGVLVIWGLRLIMKMTKLVMVLIIITQTEDPQTLMLIGQAYEQYERFTGSPGKVLNVNLWYLMSF